MGFEHDLALYHVWTCTLFIQPESPDIKTKHYVLPFPSIDGEGHFPLFQIAHVHTPHKIVSLRTESYTLHDDEVYASRRDQSRRRVGRPCKIQRRFK
jgi:hypothetical protein